MKFVDHVAALRVASNFGRPAEDLPTPGWRIVDVKDSIVTVEEDGIVSRWLMHDYYQVLGFGG